MPRLEDEGYLLLALLRHQVLEDPKITRARQAAEDRAGRRAARKGGKSPDNPFKDVSYPHGAGPSGGASPGQ